MLKTKKSNGRHLLKTSCGSGTVLSTLPIFLELSQHLFSVDVIISFQRRLREVKQLFEVTQKLTYILFRPTSTWGRTLEFYFMNQSGSLQEKAHSTGVTDKTSKEVIFTYEGGNVTRMDAASLCSKSCQILCEV